MAATACAYAYDFEKNAALNVRPQAFKVHKGGRASASSDVRVPCMPYAPDRRARANAAFRERQRQIALPALVGGLLALVVLMGVLSISDYVSHRRIAEVRQASSYTQVVVQPGDTLWGIADAHAIQGCTTDEIVRLMREVNDVDDGMLSVGEKLLVPC